jgi:hypothetical protein
MKGWENNTNEVKENRKLRGKTILLGKTQPFPNCLGCPANPRSTIDPFLIEFAGEVLETAKVKAMFV